MKLLLLVAALALPMPAAAQDHSAHKMAGGSSPAALALAEANAKMHADMNLPLTGNPDVDFVAGMVPHHQGAVDMARIVLQYGKDPEVRKFAEGVIAAQEAEILWMKDWLARNDQ
jgi:uncharacterized protein (DUF305 family)